MKRGSIEAGSITVSASMVVSFSALMKRGSIEALGVAFPGFSALMKRGSIEATYSRQAARALFCFPR